MKTNNPYEDPAVRKIFGNTLRPGGLEITAEALELAALPSGSRLIDLGCGPGATLRFLREQGFEAVGIDHSPALLAETRDQEPVLEADLARVPLADGWADGIFCECSLSLAGDKKAVLRECSRLLKPGGKLIISDLFRESESSASNRRLYSPTCCAASSISLPELHTYLHGAGFAVKEQRDHSRVLKELAAKLVWNLGSVKALAAIWPRPGDSGCETRYKVFYHLVIAAKEE